jgi:hypothetical protein
MLEDEGVLVFMLRGRGDGCGIDAEVENEGFGSGRIVRMIVNSYYLFA